MSAVMFTTKEIKGINYRIGRLGAVRGAFIFNIVMTAGGRQARKELSTSTVEAPTPKQDKTPEEKEQAARDFVTALWAEAQLEINEDLSTRIQLWCLQLCARFNPAMPDAPPDPVLMSDGRWAIKELEQDMVTVNALVAAVLGFNLAPAFTDDASSQQ